MPLELFDLVAEDEHAVVEHLRDRAKQLLGFGESTRDESLNPTEHAAWTIVAGMILNLDETLNRE